MSVQGFPATEPWSQQYPSSPRSVPAARRHLRKVLEGWGYGAEDVDRVLLVCSELATNSVRHGRQHGCLFEVRVTASGTDCLIEVSDANSTRLPRAVTATDEDESGRGLALVAALTKDTGHHLRDPIGKTVWARLELTAPEDGRHG
jgi:anti-sigma regulatory factor (Ser/Thr protein kinase)